MSVDTIDEGVLCGTCLNCGRNVAVVRDSDGDIYTCENPGCPRHEGETAGEEPDWVT